MGKNTSRFLLQNLIMKCGTGTLRSSWHGDANDWDNNYIYTGNNNVIHYHAMIHRPVGTDRPNVRERTSTRKKSFRRKNAVSFPKQEALAVTAQLMGTPVGTLPDAWRYRVSAGTGRPGVSIL